MKRHVGYNDRGFRIGYALARWLPRSVCRLLGAILGLASYAGSREAREALKGNLRRVLTDGSDVESPDAHALSFASRVNFCNFGRMLADYFYCTAANDQQIHALLDEWHGVENNLREALNRGRGVILVTAHLGNWELGGTLLALDGWPINVVTLEEPTGELTRTRDAYRKRLGIRTITVGDNTFSFVEMIAALRRNEIVCMLVDRPYGDTGVPVEFFGERTGFSSAPGLLWQHTGAAVVPAFILQNPAGRYTAYAEPAIDFQPLAATASGRRENLEQNTQKIAQVFEKFIALHPDQWFNYVPIWGRTSSSPSPESDSSPSCRLEP